MEFVVKGGDSKFQLGTDGLKRTEATYPAPAHEAENSHALSHFVLQNSGRQLPDGSRVNQYPTFSSKDNNGSDSNLQSVPSTYSKYLGNKTSLCELRKKLCALPSPRRKLFNYLISISDLSPNTLKQILCKTQSGIHPGIEQRKKLACALKTKVPDLFPDDRQDGNSLVNLYWSLPNSKTEYEELVSDLIRVTLCDRTTVVGWLYGRHTPHSSYARSQIEALLGVSITHLFPSLRTRTKNDSP